MDRFVSFTSIAFLALAYSALAVEPRLSTGPASLLSAPPAYGPASGAQRMGTLIPKDAGWFAFWADDISQGTFLTTRRVLATRLLSDGQVRDVTGLRVTTGDGYVRFTAIPEPDGARAFWASPGTAGIALYTATVSDDGEVAPAVLVGNYSADAIGSTITAAAWGTRAAVMLGRYVMIVDGTRPVRTVDLGGFGEPQSIAVVLARFVVTYVAAGNILMRQTLDLDGNVVGPAGGTAVASPASAHALASFGAATSALLARGDASGLHLGLIDLPSDRYIETALLPTGWVSPRAVWSGSSYLVAWYSYEAGSLLAVRVDSAGNLLDAEPVRVFEGDPGYFELAARGSDVAMLHQTGGCIRYSCETEVIVTMLGPDATGEHLISAAARPQVEPSVASDGKSFVAVWREGAQLFLTETSASSRTPSAPSLLFDSPGFSGTVASGGNAYMAAWMAYRGGVYVVEGAALERAGNALVPKPFALQAPRGVFPSSVSVGGAPGLFLVAWPRGEAKEAIRVDANGTILDTVPLTLPTDDYVYMPLSIAFDGEDFVVAWFSIETSVDPRVARVESVRVSRGGTPRFDRTWTTVPDGTIQGVDVGCSPDGTCLIVWIEQAAPGQLRWSLRGQRFRTGGALVDSAPFDIDVADRTQTRPSVSWDGSRFVVVWNKYIGDVTRERIEARVIPASGPAGLVPPDLLTEHDIALQPPVTACNLQGRCILAGPEFVDDDELGRTWRIVKRFFGEARHRAIRR